MDSDGGDPTTNFLLKDNGSTLLDINQDGYMSLTKQNDNIPPWISPALQQLRIVVMMLMT